MNLFGYRFVADIISHVKMGSLGWVLIQYGWYPHKKEESWTQTSIQEEFHMKTKTEIGVILLHIKEYQILSENH